MAIEIQRMEGYPALIVHLSGQVTLDQIRYLYEESAKFADEVGGHIYRITDIRDIRVGFNDLVSLMAQAASKRSGSSRISGVFVGTAENARLYAHGFGQEQYGQFHVPMFDNWNEAVACLREMMDNERLN